MQHIILSELLNGIGKFFLNPLLYWTILLVLLSGIRRIKHERENFGIKIHNVFSEWKHTWMFALLSGLILSFITLGIGMVFSFETIFVLSIIAIVLGLTLRFTMLSPSYTVGITFLLLMALPLLQNNVSNFPFDKFAAASTNYAGLVVLLGLLLIIEAIMIGRLKDRDWFSDLMLSKRGKWVGMHHLKKATIIPFFVLVPSGMITSFASFWPYISIGGETYGVLLVPFLLGFDHLVIGSSPKKACSYFAKSVGLLGVIVLGLGIGSIYITWLSIIGAVIAIVGQELIRYRHRVCDQQQMPYYHHAGDGLKVLAIIPGSPADRLGIKIGEIIHKVNDQKVFTAEAFYRALQASGAFFKLEIRDDKGEIRLLQSALYQGDHHELGILFARERHHDSRQLRKA